MNQQAIHRETDYVQRYIAASDRTASIASLIRRTCCAGVDSGGSHGWVVRILREPFVHFILLGFTTYFVAPNFAEHVRSQTISVTREQIRYIAHAYKLQFGEAPSPQQLKALVDSWITEELYYREALNLGLDVNDEIIRRRLIQKYAFLQQDLAIPAEPTESELVEYYFRHIDRYGRPETVTFTHVYFSTDVRNDEDAYAKAQALASELNTLGLSIADKLGDRFPGEYNLHASSRDEIARAFGFNGLAENISHVELRRWSPPLRSGLGWHIVYVTARQPARPLPFYEVREDVRRDYIEMERQRRNSDALEKLRRKFQVVRG